MKREANGKISKILLLFFFLFSSCSIGLDWEKFKNTLEGVILARYTISSSSIADICYFPEKDLLLAVDDANYQFLVFSSSLALQKVIPFPPYSLYSTCSYSSSHKQLYVGGDNSVNAVIDSIDLSSNTVQNQLSLSTLSSITRVISSSNVLYFLGTKANNSTIGKTTPPPFSLDTSYGNNGTSLVDSSSLYPSKFFLGIDSKGAAIAILNFPSTNSTKIIRILPGGNVGNSITFSGLSGGIYINKEENDEFWIVFNSPSYEQVLIQRYSSSFSLLEEFFYFPPFPTKGKSILKNPLVEDYEKYLVGVGNSILLLPSMNTLFINSYPIQKMIWKEEGRSVYLLTKVNSSQFEILLVE